ncbi:SWIB-domain-containing protein [Pilatotrama ljubarskyi]|nr:SWIB-domain-containing protein [Pilatotrama ljubarskyi]
MSFDVQALEPKIRAILSAPGTDLATISAKRVRKELAEHDPALTPELLKEKKDEIDAIITRVYEEVSAAQNNNGAAKSEEDDEDASSTGAAKRKRADASDPDDDEPAPAKPKKAKQKKELTDEELARQLSNEINGRQRASRAAASSKAKANGSKRGKKGPKSSATVASDGEAGDSDGEAKPKKRGGGFKKEYVLSEPLAALLKTDKLSRPQTVKQLWDHIKANNMQNPENKKEIICDDSFKAIFKCDRIDMFKMNKELGQHLHEPQPAS